MVNNNNFILNCRLPMNQTKIALFLLLVIQYLCNFYFTKWAIHKIKTKWSSYQKNKRQDLTWNDCQAIKLRKYHNLVSKTQSHSLAIHFEHIKYRMTLQISKNFTWDQIFLWTKLVIALTTACVANMKE